MWARWLSGTIGPTQQQLGYLKLVHRVLVFQRPFLPSFVYVGLFVFPLDGGTLAFGYGRSTQATAGNLEIGPRGACVPGTLPTKFGLPTPFRFPSRWRHGTDGRTDGQHRYIMGPPSRKDGPIKKTKKQLVFFSACCPHNSAQCQPSVTEVYEQDRARFTHKWKAAVSLEIWMILPR